jgi:MoaD family protein
VTGTIQVGVKLFGGLRGLVDAFPLPVSLPERATVGDLLSALSATHPEVGRRLIAGTREGYVNVLVDGRNVHLLAGLETPLADGMNVAFVPPVGGG